MKQSLAPVSTKALASFSSLNLNVRNSASSPASLLAGHSSIVHSSIVGWADPLSSFPALYFRPFSPCRLCTCEEVFLSGDS